MKPPRAWIGAIAGGAALLVIPLVANSFWLDQIVTQALCLSLVAGSLSFLIRFGGQVSLAQVAIVGAASYALAYLGPNSSGLGPHWSLAAAIPAALLAAVLVATLIGMLAARTRGIYCLMITLAIGVTFFYLARQNYSIFGGFRGIAGIRRPEIAGLSLAGSVPFYALCATVAVLAYGAIRQLGRTPLGVALTALATNPDRVEAAGYDIRYLRILAFALSGVMAGSAGILLAWFHGRISPGAVDVSSIIQILVIAVLGGMGSLPGALLGAVLYLLLENFAIDLIGAERFNSLIGGVFLVIMVASPDGLLGLSKRSALLRNALPLGPAGKSTSSDRSPSQPGAAATASSANQGSEIAG
jgi:branched-chain amino acid transport system permease protein